MQRYSSKFHLTIALTSPWCIEVESSHNGTSLPWKRASVRIYDRKIPFILQKKVDIFTYFHSMFFSCSNVFSFFFLNWRGVQASSCNVFSTLSHSEWRRSRGVSRAEVLPQGFDENEIIIVMETWLTCLAHCRRLWNGGEGYSIGKKEELPLKGPKLIRL